MNISEHLKIKELQDNVRSKKWLYFCDPMGDAKSELRDIQTELIEHRVKFPKIEIVKKPPFNENFDVLFFDWGGMSIGNSLLDHFCSRFIENAKEHPSRIYIMTSAFTKEAMKDALGYFLEREDEKPCNIFLTIADAVPYLQE